MKKFYFTFGSIHRCPEFPEFIESKQAGISLHRHYVTIEADTEHSARHIMFSRYGDKWAFCYNEAGFDGQVDEFNLIELEMIKIQTKLSSNKKG